MQELADRAAWARLKGEIGLVLAISVSGRDGPLAADWPPPPPPPKRNEESTPLHPTGIGERYSQTISNLGHAALLRQDELPLYINESAEITQGVLLLIPNSDRRPVWTENIFG